MSKNRQSLAVDPHPYVKYVLDRRARMMNAEPVEKRRIANIDEIALLGAPDSQLAMIRGQGMVQRDGTLTAGNAQGWYNYGQLLFDTCEDGSLTSLTLAGGYSPLFDIFAPSFSNLDNIIRDYLTYIGPDGLAADTPTAGIIDNACGPTVGSYEMGACKYLCGGWTSLGRKGKTRDVTQLDMRYCARQPTVRLDGSPITDDVEFDIVAATSVMLHDMHRYALIGVGAQEGQSSGIRELITATVLDTEGEECVQLGSKIIDYNGQAMCSDAGASGVTINGVAVANGYQLLDYIEDWVRYVLKRIKMTPTLRGGRPLIVALTAEELITCLISCYVCRTVCGSNDLTLFKDNDDARMERSRLLQELANGAITLEFVGVPITFMPYDYEMTDPVTGFHRMEFLTVRVGSQKTFEMHLKDMRNVERRYPQRYTSLDGGRLLLFNDFDVYCEQPLVRLDARWCTSAPYLQMSIIDVACTTIFGNLSPDPISTFFLGAGDLGPGFLAQGAVSGNPS